MTLARITPRIKSARSQKSRETEREKQKKNKNNQNTHSINANLNPIHARFPCSGFPFKNVNVLACNPGIALAVSGGFAQRSGLQSARQHRTTPYHEKKGTREAGRNTTVPQKKKPQTNSPKHLRILPPQPPTLINRLNRDRNNIPFAHADPPPPYAPLIHIPTLRHRDLVLVPHAHPHGVRHGRVHPQALLDHPVEVLAARDAVRQAFLVLLGVLPGFGVSYVIEGVQGCAELPLSEGVLHECVEAPC
jgi:hypothetical protein